MIIWVVSYPKSGNTLVRAILTSLIYSEDGNFNFNLLKKIDQYPQNHHFEALTNKFDDINELSKFWTISQDKLNLDKKIKFLKTHHLRCGIGNYTFTNSKNTIGTIYIVRDPRDVIISFAQHHSISIEKAEYTMFDSTAYEFPEREKNPDLALRTLLGSWSDHYNSCTKNNKNLLFIKYENLIKNKKSELSRIIKFVNNYIKIPTSETKINNCINSTTFESMKKYEEKGLFEENSFDKNDKKIKFFNYGKEGNWKSVLSKELVLNIEKKFQKEMKELGYI
jgi:hypothetical protein